MTRLLTGTTGFIGSHLTKLLNSKGHHIASLAKGFFNNTISAILIAVFRISMTSNGLYPMHEFY